MKEKNLRNLALICSVAGLILLFFISTQITSPEIEIEKITLDDVGNNVKVCGTITSKRVSNNHIFMTLEDPTASIRFVIFNSTALGLKNKGNNVYELNEKDSICTFGVVEEYPKGSGQLELIYRKGTIEKV